ncbi:unnamed protein product [Arabis nemorensis]|uniref:Uncharacterized protein n=1 Tax=Arabis nemorensis TaxID=586526 RepID=A0A565BSU2_9BRAS|nr:unnamed protein product [Arabis nemorensis]
MEIDCLLLSLALCGFDVESIVLKSSETSCSAQIEGSTTRCLIAFAVIVDLTIVNCALVAVSIAEFRSLDVFSNF